MNDDDLVTLTEAERELRLPSRQLSALWQRRREGAVVDLPDPVVVGRSVRLWSLAQLRDWWPKRVDGRTLRHIASLDKS